MEPLRWASLVTTARTGTKPAMADTIASQVPSSFIWWAWAIDWSGHWSQTASCGSHSAGIRYAG